MLWDDDVISDPENEVDFYSPQPFLPIYTANDSFEQRYLIGTPHAYLQPRDLSPVPSFTVSPPPSLLFENLNLNSPKHSQKSKKVNTNIMDKLGSCKKFSGYPKENGLKFLKNFESFATLHELEDDEDDNRKIAAFHLHLQGPALSWFLSLSDDLDWDTVKQRFQEKYIDFGWEHPSVVIENELFNNMKLIDGQEIEDYFCQMTEKAQLLSKPDHEVMAKFINGLPDKLAFYVRASKPRDSSEALTFAKTGEAYKYRETERTVAAARNVAMSNSPEIEGLKCQVNQLADMVKGIYTNTNNTQKHDYKPRQSRQNTGYSNQRRSGPCFNCNGSGHIKSKCNWNGTGNVSLHSTCQLCSQNGHTATQCNTFARQHKSVNMSTIQCQICSQNGHCAPQCPQLQQGNSSLLGATWHDPPGEG